MSILRSEHVWPHTSRMRLLAGVLASFCLGLAGFSAVRAIDPPQPDFFWPYGRVQLDGANIAPAAQRVIGIVNGRACGEAETFLVDEGPGVPPADAGKTVYVVDVLADGPNAGQRPGCGHPGDTVTLYFPDAHRFAVQQAAFVPGSARLDVDLGPELSHRLPGPMLASDGVN